MPPLSQHGVGVVATAGTGTVYTYTVVRQAFIPSLATSSPTS